MQRSGGLTVMRSHDAASWKSRSLVWTKLGKMEDDFFIFFYDFIKKMSGQCLVGYDLAVFRYFFPSVEPDAGFSS